MAFLLKICALLLIGGFFFGPVSVLQARESALAIFNLRPTNFEAMGYDGDILYALVSALERKKAVELMPRREMEEILSQKAMVQSDDPHMVSKAGKLLGINFILFGQVTKKEAHIISTLHLMDIQRDQVIKTWQKQFSGREDILAQIPLFAEQLIRILHHHEGMGTTASAGPAPSAVEIENLRAQNEGHAAVLRWRVDPSQSIAGFNIYRSESADGPYQFTGKARQSPFTDQKIKQGRTYYYRIGIILQSGREAKFAMTAQIKNAGEITPHPPLIMESKGFVRRAELQFVPSLLNAKEKIKITKYLVYRKSAQSEVWENIAAVKAKKLLALRLGFMFKDRLNLDDGRTYMYAVSSIDKEMKESPRSDSVAVATIKRPLLTLEKENLLRKNILTWDSIDKVLGYYLYRRSGQEDWGRVGKIKGAQISRYTDSNGLEDGQGYHYYLSAFDKEGETGPSNEVQAKTKDLPPTPGNFKTQSGLVKSVRLEWAALQDTDIGGYAIYRGLHAKVLHRIAKTSGNQSGSFIDKGKLHKALADGVEYFYAVASYNLFGAEGDLSAVVSARTKPRPVAVTGLGLAIHQESDTHGSITLTWAPNSEPDIEAYLIYRRRNDGYWSKTATVPAGETRFEDSNLKAESIYRYRLIALDKDGLESDTVESKSVKSPVVSRKGFLSEGLNVLPKGLKDIADRLKLKQPAKKQTE